MGNTYANITLKGPQAQDILQELSDQGRLAFVSPTEDDLTTVYEMDSDEEGETRLSTLPKICPAVSAVRLWPCRLWAKIYSATGCMWTENWRTHTPRHAPTGRNISLKVRAAIRIPIQYFNHEVSAEEISDVLHCCDQDCDFSWPQIAI